jgi:hypothetical protein
MAVASSLSSNNFAVRRLTNVFADIAAAQTDSVLVTAVPGHTIRVVAAFINAVDAGVGTVTFKSKPGGAGSAISPPIKLNASSGAVLGHGEGWFETKVGEALAIDTAAASATNLILVYELDT